MSGSVGVTPASKIIPTLSDQHKETRPLIINWLEEVASDLNLKDRTLHWALLLHDRYMEKINQSFDYSVRDYS